MEQSMRAISTMITNFQVLLALSKAMECFPSLMEEHSTVDAGKKINFMVLAFSITFKLKIHKSVRKFTSITKISTSTITLYGHNMKASFSKIKSTALEHYAS
jgi:hypothetical protein